MTILTDRYIWAVRGALPAAQRDELEPEVRALVADAIEARAADGLDADAAERAAITELGDPKLLAARYVERPRHLIGPAVFPEWRRLLTLLLPIVVPIVSGITLVAQLASDAPVGQAIVATLATAFNVALQLVFWVTLVFAAIERAAVTRSDAPARAWSPDDLPELPDDGRIGFLEFAGLVITSGAVALGLLWVQLQSPFVVDGESFPLFDPALWSFWLPWFLAIAVLDIVFAIALYRRGRWTWGFAIGNAVLGAAFAIPAVYLLQNDMLLNPALIAKVEATVNVDSWIDVTRIIILTTVVIVVAWDAIDGFLKARRAANPAVRRTAG
jgi:hypothetical protein